MARPRQVSDEQILEHARTVFLDHGPAASTQSIADAAGVSQATLFKRFGSKDELMVQALMPPEAPPFLDALEAGPYPGDLRQQLCIIATLAGGFFELLIPRMSTFHACGIDPKDMLDRYEVPPPVRARRAMTAYLDRAVDQGRLRPCNTAAIAVAFFGALQGRAFMQHVMGAHMPALPLDDYARTLVDTFLDGLGPVPTSPGDHP